jgi:hypothetical protein
MVVGDHINLTGYESLVNWHPANIDLLLRGFKRPPGDGVMAARQVRILLEEMADEVVRCSSEGGFPAKSSAPLDGRSPEQLLLATSAVLARRRRCASRMGVAYIPSERLVSPTKKAASTTARIVNSDSSASSGSSSASLPRRRIIRGRSRSRSRDARANMAVADT